MEKRKTIGIEQKNVKAEIRFGIFSGAGMSIMLIFQYFLGFHEMSLRVHQFNIYALFIFPIMGYYLMYKKIKANYGIYTFKDIVNKSLIYSLVSAFIFTFYLNVYSRYINADWIQEIVEYQKLLLKQNGASLEIIANYHSDFEILANPNNLLIIPFVLLTIIITIIGIFEGILLKKLQK